MFVFIGKSICFGRIESEKMKCQLILFRVARQDCSAKKEIEKQGGKSIIFRYSAILVLANNE